MNTLRRWKQRIERLEDRMGSKRVPQLIYITPNLEAEGDDSAETPWSVKIAPGVWATAFGTPFCSEDIERLRKKYAYG